MEAGSRAIMAATAERRPRKKRQFDGCQPIVCHAKMMRAPPAANING